MIEYRTIEYKHNIIVRNYIVLHWYIANQIYQNGNDQYDQFDNYRNHFIN